MQSSAPSPSPPPKATLFCPSCDHQSHVDRDWQSNSSVTKVRYRCPECGTVIATRPKPTDPGAESPPESVLVTCWETISESTRVWSQFLDETMRAR